MSEYGGMDTQLWVNKQMTTCVFEKENQVNSFQRDLLTDMRPDETFLASDAPRDNSWYSSAIIKSRDSGNGNLSGLTPDLPDGTFLDADFTDPDPRGTQTEPDMQKMRTHYLHRKKLIDKSFTPDHDYSVPSQGRNPARVDADKRAGFYNLKDRLKIFSTALDNRINSVAGVYSGQYGRDYTHSVETLEKNGIYDFVDGGEVHAGKTTKLSNMTEIGYRSTSDHRFNIAKYGRIIKSKSINKQWNGNKNLLSDDRKQRTFENQYVPKSVVLGMKWAMREKINHDSKFGTTHDTRVYKWAKYFPERPLRKTLYDGKLPIASRITTFLHYRNGKLGKHGGNARSAVVDGKILKFIEMATNAPKNPKLTVDVNRQEKMEASEKVKRTFEELIHKGKLPENFTKTARSSNVSHKDKRVFEEVVRKLVRPKYDSDIMAKQHLSGKNQRGFGEQNRSISHNKDTGETSRKADIFLKHDGKKTKTYKAKHITPTNIRGADAEEFENDSTIMQVYKTRSAESDRNTNRNADTDNNWRDGAGLIGKKGTMWKNRSVMTYTSRDNDDGSEKIKDSFERGT